jgi:hypothetical protein
MSDQKADKGLMELQDEFERKMMFAAFTAIHPRSRPCHIGIKGSAFSRCWNPTVMGGILLCDEHGGREALARWRLSGERGGNAAPAGREP